MIKYIEDCENIEPAMLTGFFEGWPNPPDTEMHLKILRQSQHVVLALDDANNRVVGFINAVSDNVHSAYIPLLEVLPEYRKRGIGREMVERMLKKLNHIYDISLICDANLNDFYERFDMKPFNAMIIRNYDRQSGSN